MDGNWASPRFSPNKPSISVVIPVHNEVDNVLILEQELVSVLQTLSSSWEICFVNDGSTDGTEEKLNDIADTFPHTIAIHLTRRFGQAAALRAGFEHTRGDIVVTLDGDLQNDPRDIPHLLDKLNEGYDIVHGWRKNRQDRWLSRRMPSVLANWLISTVTGVNVPDLGCGIRAMRRWVADHLDLVGEMHRYLPILAENLGARSTVLAVNHRAREFGKSKYGLGRIFRVLCDIPVILWLTRFRWAPMRSLIGLGVINAMLIAGVLLFSLLIEGLFSARIPISVLLATSAIILGGIATFALGLVTELLVRGTSGPSGVYIIRYQSGHETICPILQLPHTTQPNNQGQTIRPTGT
ncbi:MAG: glycosyltransferase family 2 protein [Thermogutta sp.]